MAQLTTDFILVFKWLMKCWWHFDNCFCSLSCLSHSNGGQKWLKQSISVTSSILPSVSVLSWGKLGTGVNLREHQWLFWCPCYSSFFSVNNHSLNWFSFNWNHRQQSLKCWHKESTLNVHVKYWRMMRNIDRKFLSQFFSQLPKHN